MFGTHQKNDRWGDYEGEGIWTSGSDTGGPHPIHETADFREAVIKLGEDVGQTSREIYEEFQIGKDGGRWDALPDEGYIRFTLEDGRTSYASYGVAASWAEHSHSWLWSWAMPKGWVHPNAQVVSKRAHDFGQDQCWDALTTKSLLVNEMEAWNLTKLVAHASDMPLVYRAKVNDINWHYFALSRPSWSN